MVTITVSMDEVSKQKANQKEGDKLKTKFVNRQPDYPDYMIFPKFLLNLRISETSKILYMILFDRTRLSQRDSQWQDPSGNVFVFYRIEKLAAKLHKGKTAIENSLSILEKIGLIRRVRQGIEKPNKIYVKIPIPEEIEDNDYHNSDTRETGIKTAGFTDVTGPEMWNQDDRKYDNQTTTNAATINNKNSNNKRVRTRSNNPRSAYGRYNNVYLSVEEMEAIQKDIPEWKDYVERLSEYMQSKGAVYMDHAATILNWARKDNKLHEEKDYSFEEGMSL